MSGRKGFLALASLIIMSLPHSVGFADEAVITCSEALMAKPIWVSAGRVPKGFWDNKSNRVAYLRWLGNRLGYREPADWYRVQKSDFEQNFGSTLANTIPVTELPKDLYPNFRFSAMELW